MFKKTFHILIIVLLGPSAFGQVFDVEAKYSTDTVKIGEQLLLELSFTYQKVGKDSLVWPEFDNFLTNEVEIINKSGIKQTIIDSVNDISRHAQRFVLTSFNVGANAIPALQVSYNDSVYTSQPYQLLVGTVAVDTSKGIYDIRPIIEVKYKLANRINDWFIDNWYWVIIPVLLLIIVFLLYKYSKKDKTETVVAPPPIPAHISALSILNALAKSKAWESEDKKAYYSSVTDTVRKYLEERFEIQAMEETTVEIIKDLKYSDIISKDKFFLQEILQQADMVKFAKFKPDNHDGEIVLEKSIEFVERTKIDEVTKARNKTTNE